MVPTMQEDYWKSVSNLIKCILLFCLFCSHDVKKFSVGRKKNLYTVEEYVHMVKDGIIDPVKVIQTTLQNAARTSTLMMARSIMLNELRNVEVDDSLLVVQSHETGFRNKKWSLRRRRWRAPWRG
ncbi:uncharacterized protein LOC119302506 [Triticum dicoccoides]|uniref:uncharacterized protein LOC119302506 n=1 Tax=Triticum dicoccoides TaxID=85692 RepID=UPI00188DC996|nr:uncharacterized protein LOC119302506 [Triticum dicoccoides]